MLSPLLLKAALPAGRAIQWGQYVSASDSLPFPDASNVVQVSAANIYQSYGLYSMVLMRDGTVRVWGYPETGPVPLGLSNIVKISAGPYAVLALRTDGSVVAWGKVDSNGLLSTAFPSGLTNVVDIISTFGGGLALKADGTVSAWGARAITNVPPGLSNVSQIATDSAGALALQSNGNVVAWGSHLTNMPTALSNIVGVAASWGAGFALRADGTVIQWVEFEPYLAVPNGLSNVVQIIAGANNVVALKRDGRAVVWGRGASSLLTPPSSLSNVVSVALSTMHFIALTIDPQITAIEHKNQQYTVRFPSFSGQQYTVESSPNLSPGNWTNLTTIPGTGYEATVTDTNAAGSVRFYRLRQP